MASSDSVLSVSTTVQKLIKDIEEDTNKWKDIPCPCTRRMNIVKISTVLKTIYKSMAIKTL